MPDAGLTAVEAGDFEISVGSFVAQPARDRDDSCRRDPQRSHPSLRPARQARRARVTGSTTNWVRETMPSAARPPSNRYKDTNETQRDPGGNHAQDPHRPCRAIRRRRTRHGMQPSPNRGPQEDRRRPYVELARRWRPDRARSRSRPEVVDDRAERHVQYLPGAPHGLTGAHEQELNADLLAFPSPVSCSDLHFHVKDLP